MSSRSTARSTPCSPRPVPIVRRSGDRRARRDVRAARRAGRLAARARHALSHERVDPLRLAAENGTFVGDRLEDDPRFDRPVDQLVLAHGFERASACPSATSTARRARSPSTSAAAAARRGRPSPSSSRCSARSQSRSLACGGLSHRCSILLPQRRAVGARAWRTSRGTSRRRRAHLRHGGGCVRDRLGRPVDVVVTDAAPRGHPRRSLRGYRCCARSRRPSWSSDARHAGDPRLRNRGRRARVAPGGVRRADGLLAAVDAVADGGSHLPRRREDAGPA